MALIREENTSWGRNRAGYVDYVYDDATLDVTQIIYANGDTRARVVEVYRMPQNTLAIPPRTLAPGTPETTVAAPNNVRMVADAEGSLSLDQWRVQTRYA